MLSVVPVRARAHAGWVSSFTAGAMVDWTSSPRPLGEAAGVSSDGCGSGSNDRISIRSPLLFGKPLERRKRGLLPGGDGDDHFLVQPAAGGGGGGLAVDARLVETADPVGAGLHLFQARRAV